VFSFADHSKSGLFKGSNGPFERNIGEKHLSDNLDFVKPALFFVGNHLEVCLDGVFHVFERFFQRFALRVTTGKKRTVGIKTKRTFMDGDGIFHNPFLASFKISIPPIVSKGDIKPAA
jgi:hypothetical protein